MAASREGWNLLSRYGWGVFWRASWKRRWGSRENIWKDTFGRFVCRTLGHSKKLHDISDLWDTESKTEQRALLCDRCYRVVSWV